MKKILIITCMLLVLTSCSYKTQPINENNKQNIKTSTTKEEIKDTYIDNNPITLGIYMYTNSSTPRYKKDLYQTTWTQYTDICSLEIFYTNEEQIPGTNFKSLWNNYYQNYTNIDSYKIGYLIEFETTNEGKIKKYIKSPQDTEEIYKYIQLYLYDDIHQDGGWYSHITKEEYSNDNILTSIKLTASTNIDEITSDISLTAFTYDDDDFDENGEYRGISKQTVIIKRS